MNRSLCPTATPRFISLLEAAKPARPMGFYLMENLLTARAGSMFPTNGAGPDEDVNVYLVHLLGHFLRGKTDPMVKFGSEALFCPPAKTTSATLRSEHYRVNADHRLLHLGLFDRGDGLRRRDKIHGLTLGETRARDLVAGRTMYEAAAGALRRRRGNHHALRAVLEKLAANFNDYVHVIAALATRHLGLGARLSHRDLTRLLPPDATANSRAVDSLLLSAPPAAAFDGLLDLWLAHAKNPAPATAALIRDMADRLGVELQLG